MYPTPDPAARAVRVAGHIMSFFLLIQRCVSSISSLPHTPQLVAIHRSLAMSHQSVPTLKRPRSTSTPPSPSSTSSPKRAASEDPFPSSSDSGRGNDFLNPSMQAGNAGSSPLRLDFDDEPEQLGEGESGWVRRTEEVHLGCDRVDGGKERLLGQFSELLGRSSSLHSRPCEVSRSSHNRP